MKALLAAVLLTSTTAFAQIQVKCHVYSTDASDNDSSVSKTLSLPAGAVTGEVSIGEVQGQKIKVQISARGHRESFVSAVCADQSQYSQLLLCAKGTLEIQTMNYDRVTTTISCSTVK